jgi:hypothetical protein
LRSRFWIVVVFVLLIRLPFLRQAIQGDDQYYLTAAQYAQSDPLHPHHAKFILNGEPMDMRGHPHPPGDAWILAALLAAVGDIREVPFHAAYIGFSLLAAFSMWVLARRFAPAQELIATLLFCAVPAFVVNGNSLEADLPFLAFWMAGIAAFIERRLVLAFLALFAAGMLAYQAVVAVPILAVYLWLDRRDDRASWLVLTAPIAAIGGYQLFERVSSGSTPVAILGQHFETYGMQRIEAKLRSAVALCGHLAVMVTPLGLWALLRKRHPFLSAWAAIFFAAALVLFFAGSARYLLPMAAPVAIITALYWQQRPRVLWLVLAVQLSTGLSLAVVNYQHWGGYREFVAKTCNQRGSDRLWVDAEWGLRFYAEACGALPIVRGQTLRPGDWVLTSGLSPEIPYTTGGGQAVVVDSRAITPTLPMRLIGPGTGSGYSSVGFGLWPFGWSTAPADTVSLAHIVEVRPTLSWLPMNSPETAHQIISGVYNLEGGAWRWMGSAATFILKPPTQPRPLAAEFFIPDTAPGRRVTLTLDGKPVSEQTYAGPGKYRIETAALTGSLVTLSVDRDFQVPGDNRRLGMIVTAVGFVE